MKYYILFGPPGAGKGTQAGAIAEKYNLKHVSTGELLRSEIAAGTELGMQAKALMDAGALVPDSIVEGMLSHIFDTTSKVAGFLLDGFPRNLSQAQDLDEMLSKRGEKVDAVLSLMISDDTIRERIKHRAEVEGRADDANDETINNRIRTYHERTEPLIDYYKGEGKYNEIDAESGGIEVVRHAVLNLFMDGIDRTHLSGRQVFDGNMLDELLRRANESPRMRMNYDLRNSEADTSTRMLNVMMPGTVTQIHRHKNSNETVIMLRGSMDMVLYTDEGVEEVRYHLGGTSGVWGLSVPKDKFHTMEVFEPTIMFVGRDGAYKRTLEEETIEKKK